MRQRADAVQAVAEPAARASVSLGIDLKLTVEYRPRSRAADPEQLAQELGDRVERDIERGFTGHGPHRDELAILLSERDLRAYGSQGQQRVSLLALLLAEREAISDHRGAPPLMLLDDVMSELDQPRREALVELLRGDGGQSILTTTELEHVPGAGDAGVVRLAVADGVVREEAIA
jgi:DNA replication and repair protein RecF